VDKLAQRFGRVFGVAELRYELPSPLALSPGERGAFNSCPLTLGERARVRGNLAIHTRSNAEFLCKYWFLFFFINAIPLADAE